MSYVSYENETCEGCTIFYRGAADQICRRDGSAVTKQMPACQRFRPSLQCRQTRALETIADALEGSLRDVGHGTVIGVTQEQP